MKTILVTRGNRGIGLEICRQLDNSGYTVILCSRDMDKGREAAGSLSKNVFVGQLDVTDEASIAGLFDVVSKRFGKIDVLINNAGFYLSGLAEETSIEQGKKQLDTNFWGTVKLTNALLPYFRKQRFCKYSYIK